MATDYLTQLLSASTAIITETDLKKLYRKITTIMKEFLNLDFSTVMILSDDKRHLVIRDAIGFPETMINTFTLVEGQGLSTWVVRNRKPGITEDFHQEKRFEVPSVVFAKGIRSALCVPMMLGEEIFGVFIGHTLAPRSFSQEDVYFCQTFANQAAVTIKNSMHMLALKEAEEKYREIYNNVTDAIFLISLDSNDSPGHFIDANQIACARYGYPCRKIQSLRLEDITAPDRRSELPSFIATLCRHGRELVETDHLTAVGDIFPVEISAHLFDLQGERTILSVVRDISERLRNEQEKRLLEEKLVQAQKMESIGRLAGGVAHDFNNVLSSILGYSELALMRITEDTPLRKDIEAIRDAGEKAAALTRQLLAFSRKQVLEVKAVSLNSIVQDLRQLLSKMLGEDIEMVVCANAMTGVVEADIGQIEQVVMNLAVNARDAMPGGGRLVIETQDVTLDSEYTARHPEVSPGAYVMLAVTDCGEGMSKDVLEHIFDPFFTTKERGKGTGLGLATVHGIIKQHKGHIHAYSEPGNGTIFKIFFPASNREVAQREKKPEAPLRGGQERILVVDDERSIRELVVSTLLPWGYICSEASCASEAIQGVGQGAAGPDLLITDVIMPGMNGKELADELLDKVPGLKVIFMSGYTDNAIVHHGVLEEGVNYIQKPVTPSVLLRKIRAVLDG